MKHRDAQFIEEPFSIAVSMHSCGLTCFEFYISLLTQPSLWNCLFPTENVRDIQAILARAMLRRHYQEREVILSVLQDPGLDELVEAAAVMPPEQALRRLKELKTKRDGLDLEDKGDDTYQYRLLLPCTQLYKWVLEFGVIELLEKESLYSSPL